MNIKYNYLTLLIVKIFLSFAAYDLFQTLSSSGGCSVHKTLLIDVKSFRQYIKVKRKLSVLSICRTLVGLVTCNENSKNIIQMF